MVQLAEEKGSSAKGQEIYREGFYIINFNYDRIVLELGKKKLLCIFPVAGKIKQERNKSNSNKF